MTSRPAPSRLPGGHEMPDHSKPTRFPTRTIERHLRTGGLRSLVVPRSGICPLCAKCTGADRGRIPAGRRSGQVPDSTQSIHDEQRGCDQ